MEDAKVYRQQCEICHGTGGPITPTAQGMFPRPPQLLHGKGVTDDPAGETYWKVKNGIRLTGMPAFGGAGSEHGNTDSSWKLVRFIRHLPALTPEERLEMEKYNPKGLEDREEEEKEKNFLNGAPAKPSPRPEQHHH